MKRILFSLLMAYGLCPKAQPTLDPSAFFRDTLPVDVELYCNIKQVINNKLKEGMKFPAIWKMRLPDSTEITAPVSLEVRGNFRKATCYLPPLKVQFKSAASPLSALGSLKLVNICEPERFEYEEYILKEYLTYRIYNTITDKSFRARLLRLRFIDSNSKRKPLAAYAFLLEDVKDMASRNNCVERKRDIERTDLTNRQHMTTVALFEYMIANADWSVPVRHNIKLIVDRSDTTSIPFAVPYDFDHSGLVNAEYALPPPQLDIKQVTQRYYMGFARSMEELEEAAQPFLQQQEKINGMIMNFSPLSMQTRKRMVSYLKEFFEVLRNRGDLKVEFINNARRN